jgi:prepilin-type N-terminal cleavage/methylation domain-containing protein
MKNSGFTIIELITVMAILGIMFGVSAIYARDWLERYQVEVQTKEMYADLMNARVCALQKNRVVFVTLSANQYAIYEDTHSLTDGDGTLQTASDRLVVRKPTRFPLEPRLGFGRTTFQIRTNGLVSLDGSIHFNSSVNTLYDCIVLFSTRIRMGKWNEAISKCVTR